MTETLTFLFTDLEGSTRLWERYPEAMRGALQRHDAILKDAVEATGGRVVKSTGDGMMAVFGGVAEGVTASLTAQRRMASEAWPATGPLRVRMGLHAGEAQHRGEDYFGPTVNRSARIMAAGHGGQVLLSAAAASLAAGGLPMGASLQDLGAYRLKGLDRAEHVFQLIHPDLAARFPPLSAAGAGSDIPTRAAAFIGRRAELGRIVEGLKDPSIALLTLVGPGGTGKTTLAIRAAGEAAPAFADGVTFVDLTPARTTDAVVLAIARAAGVTEVPGNPLGDDLAASLGDRHLLLVLDNLEQVTGAAGPVVADLLARCPALNVLATSREALHLRAEHIVAIPPMSVPPASGRRVGVAEIEGCESVQLFVDRAQAIRQDFALTDDNAAAVAEICRRLDGLPLAIELAAARLRLFSPDALVRQLDHRLKVLSAGPRDLPERQQTLRATIDWSYDLLSPDERRLFGILSAFAGAAITDVEALVADVEDDSAGPDTLDVLASLVEKSLVRVDDAAEEPRIAMLQTIREFAAAKLDEDPAFAARVRRAHAECYADFAVRLRPDLNDSRRRESLEALAAELGNLRIAWAYWAAAEDLDRLGGLFKALLPLNDARGWYLDTVALTTDLIAVLSRGARAPERIAQEIALRTSLARALMTARGFTPEVEETYAAAIRLFERDTDAGQQFPALRGLSRLYELLGQSEASARIGERILLLAERDDNLTMRVDGERIVATHSLFHNDLEGGLTRLDRAIALFRDAPVSAVEGGSVGADPRVPCLTTSAFTLWLLGRPEQATARAGEAIALAAELDHPFTNAYARFHASLLSFWLREFDAARAGATELLRIADDYEFRIWTAAGQCLRGAALSELGALDDGEADIRAGMDLYQGLRSPPVFWPMLLGLEAGACLRAGRTAAGLALVDQVIGIMGAGEGTSLLPGYQVMKGDLLAAAGDPAAGDWYRQAFDRAGRIGARLPQLRAAIRLYRLAGGGSERERAVEALAAVYASFTEGFATPDLVEAREVLGRAATP